MSTTNMRIWEQVQTTDTRYTKNAEVGGQKITNLNGTAMVMKASEMFGPVVSVGAGRCLRSDSTTVTRCFPAKATSESAWAGRSATPTKSSSDSCRTAARRGRAVRVHPAPVQDQVRHDH